MPQKRQSLKNKNTNKLFIIVSILAFAFFIVLAQVSSHLNTDEMLREPASIQTKQKFKHLHEKLSVHQKIKPPIEVYIDKNVIGKVYAGDEFEVTAKVSSTVDTQNAKVEWSLPRYVEVINGELLHTFENLKAGESHILRLTLKSHSEDNQQIHITATAPYGKQVLSSVDQFNTTVEQELKEAKADLVQRNLDYIEQNK